MTEQGFNWLTLDVDEELVWSGNPKIQRLLGIEFTDYVVTDQAIYRKSGILSRNVQKIGLDKVQNISFSQGILGKQLGYGNIEISTAGGSGVEMMFRGVQNPKEVQEKINSMMIGKNQGRSEDGKTQKDILNEILSEVKEINEKL